MDPITDPIIARLGKSDKNRPVRQISYKCVECETVWVRFTDQRVVAATSCPFCGGRGRMTEESDEGVS